MDPNLALALALFFGGDDIRDCFLAAIWGSFLRFGPNHAEKTKGNTTATEQHDIRCQWLAFS